VIEEGDRTVAVISPVKGPGRLIDECIALAKERSFGVTLDEGFAKDLDEIIAQRKPLDTSAWFSLGRRLEHAIQSLVLPLIPDRS
jgi:hypothetical protein